MKVTDEEQDLELDPDPDPDPDPIVRGTDLRTRMQDLELDPDPDPIVRGTDLRTRISTKMSRIRKTGFESSTKLFCGTRILLHFSCG